MSFQQKRLRANRLLQQCISDIKCWTDNTYLLRCTMFSFSNLEVSLADRQYLDSRWKLLEGYLLCTSASELAMKMEIAKCSVNFQPIDFVAIALGYCQQNASGYMFEHEVIVEMIDNYNFFDNAFRNTKFLRMLLKCATQNSICYLGKQDAPRRLFAHIVKKFPDIKKMNFMYIKSKNGKIINKVKDKELEEWL